jgi:hypothetical protein
MSDLKLTSSLLSMLERIEKHSGTLLMLAVTASGGQDGKLNKLRGVGYVVKCDHPSVTEGGWPAEALAITEAGGTALANHHVNSPRKKGVIVQPTNEWCFVATASATLCSSAMNASGLCAARVTGIGTTLIRRWRIRAMPRPEREPVSYCAAATSAWFGRA